MKRFSGGVVQTDKTFRVFASTDQSKGGLFKVSGKSLGPGKNPEQFANTPEHCFVINDDDKHDDPGRTGQGILH